jgi:hypothetical protein
MRPDPASAPAFWPIFSAFALSGGEWHRRFRIPRRALVRSGLNCLLGKFTHCQQVEW